MSSPNPSNLVSRLRAWPWTSVFARVVAVTVALAVLAWIGRAASANANAPPLAIALDAAAPVVPPSSAPLPSPAVTPPPIPLPGLPRGRATADDPVFLNQADEADLRRLPGIGAKRAEAIVSLRKRVGRFLRLEDLMRVKGIGRAAIKKWRPLVRLDSPPTPDAGSP